MFNQDQEPKSSFQYFYQTEGLGYCFHQLELSSHRSVIVHLLPTTFVIATTAAAAASLVEACYLAQVF